ncbi:MAG: excinuclease ABC subunit UvrC [Bacteroidaceae bacterium]|nr:excinuclease ABC subunit UvrC [Bacteroidaceae bacterium]
MAKDQERLERLKAIVSAMPQKPGSYQYYDESGTVIYVGKAKNLKSRVSSYFHKEVDRFKTKVLVSKIHNITYTVVNTEEDALLLENNLIKKYNPKYNILLKDGKTYPSICITKEYFPRIFHTRNINKKFGIYFGPYSHIGTMYALLDLIKKLYHPRTCRLPITEKSVIEGKHQTCLDYHIKNCLAPCVGKQSYDDYMKNIQQAKEILKGNTRQVSKVIFTEMMKASEEMRFEDAEELKRKYQLLEGFVAKSEVVSNTINDVDVFSITDDEQNAFLNYMHVANGSINQSRTFEIKKKLGETKDEILSLSILQIREEMGSTAKEIVVEEIPETQLEGITYTVPQRGDKRTLLELSQLNCKQYRFDRLKQAEKLNPEQRTTRILKELQTALGMDRLPYSIECFDNSNISGEDAVAGCVVFKGGKPSKKDYRKYNIKTVVGPDDYASMKEVVRRRYSRMIEEGSPLPDLIITDGGKGQMEVVRQVIMDELHIDIPIAGLAKDDRHRTNELLFGFPPLTVGLKTTSEAFKMLTRLQDEVHRYAITFHRDKRSKHALHSELDDIPGIGPKTKEQLLKALKSLKRIKEASKESLEAIVGAKKAEIITEYFSRETLK